MTFKEYIQLEESRLGKIAGIGAAATLPFLTPGDKPEDQTIAPVEQLHDTIEISQKQIVQLWSRYYQTDQNQQKEERALKVIQQSFQIPNDARKAIKTAVNIFGGDMGIKDDVLELLLYYTGAIESNYREIRQKGGGPARSYWQVEPETAIDLLSNSSALFGPKFKQRFGEEIIQLKEFDNEYTKQENLKKMAQALEQDSDLGAAFAAAKWIVSAHSVLKKF